MIDTSKIPREQLFRCQSPMLEMDRVARGKADFREWLSLSLLLAKHSLVHWLVRKPFYFDGVSEVELWFEADVWDVRLTVIVVTK